MGERNDEINNVKRNEKIDDGVTLYHHFPMAIFLINSNNYFSH